MENLTCSEDFNGTPAISGHVAAQALWLRKAAPAGPSLICRGPTPHATSAAWALAELMPNAEPRDVLPPRQTGAEVLARMIAFRQRVGQGGAGTRAA